MKLLLFFSLITILCNIVDLSAQTQFEIQDETASRKGSEFLATATGLGAQSRLESIEDKSNFLSNVLSNIGLFNDGSSGLSLESGTSIINYFIILKRRPDTIDTVGRYIVTSRYSGINFSIMSRGKIVFDTLNNVFTDYIGSLQASPLTMRLKYQYRLNEKNYLIDTMVPQVSVRASLDGRISPFSKTSTNNVITGTFHFALGISTAFQSVTMQNDQVVDKGLWYADASFIAVGGDRAALHSLTNDNRGWLANFDIRLGYKSSTLRSRDFGLLIRSSHGIESSSKWSITFTGSTEL